MPRVSIATSSLESVRGCAAATIGGGGVYISDNRLVLTQAETQLRCLGAVSSSGPAIGHLTDPLTNDSAGFAFCTEAEMEEA